MLNDISLKVPAGSKVGVCGRTGRFVYLAVDLFLSTGSVLTDRQREKHIHSHSTATSRGRKWTDPH